MAHRTGNRWALEKATGPAVGCARPLVCRQPLYQ